MEEEKNNNKLKDFKTGLKDKDKNFERHFKAKTEITKNKREERLEELRKKSKESQPLIVDNISEFVRSVSIKQFLNEQEPIQIVEQLLKVLKTQDIEFYYSPSDAFKNPNNGPYLFQNDQVIIKLISLLSSSKNIPLLINVTHCLICISAHPECLIWTTKLLKHNILQYSMGLLESCPNEEVRENIIWMLSNIMLDSQLTREYIINNGGTKLFKLICKSLNNGDNPKIKSVCGFFLLSLLKELPLPEFKLIEELWNLVINNVFLHEYKEANDVDATYRLILRILVRVSQVPLAIADEYRKNICYNKMLMKRLLNPLDKTNNLELFANADIINSLTFTIELHELLIKNNILNFFVYLIDNQDPRIRILGISGARLLATNRFSIEFLMKNDTLNVILKHFEYSKQHDLQIQLKLLLSQIVNTIAIFGIVNDYYPKIFDKNIHKEIVLILSEQHDLTLLSIGVTALKNLVKFNPVLMKDVIEDFGYLDRLDNLCYTSKDKGISNTSEQIIEMIDKSKTLLDADPNATYLLDMDLDEL